MRYWFLILLVLGFLYPGDLQAAERGFAPRFTANDTGDIVFVGNTLMTLTGVAPATISNVQNGATTGTNANNNTYFMEYVDVDPSANLGNSSSAVLNLPSGSTVLWAGLYWGANVQLPVGNVTYNSVTYTPNINSGTAAKDKIKFKVPGGSYQALTATDSDTVGLAGDVTNYGQPYSSFVEITSLVKSAGNGTYTAGQVLAARGKNRYAVWTMVVVYSNPSLSPKNLTVFDGFKIIGAAIGTPGVNGGTTVSALDIPISGFTAPPYGNVNTKLGVMSYEGDVGYSGDALLMGPTTAALKPVSDSLNPSDNFANSTISYMGNYAGSGAQDPGYPSNPVYRNQLGVDADIMTGPEGAVANNGTSAVVRFTTNQDAYYPAVLTTAIDLYAPQVQAAKTVVDTNGDNVTPGDILAYTITFKNRDDVDGDDTKNTILTDVLPPEITYVPGSLRVVRVGQTGETVLTDIGDSDDGEVITSGTTETITVRLGHPYNPPNHNGTGSPGGVGTSGGVVKRGETIKVSFNTRVKIGLLDGTKISNEAKINYESLASGVALVASVAPVSVNNSKVITGVLFEDVQYGGGAGRGPLQATTLDAAGTLPVPAGAKPIPNARVELYGPKDGAPEGSPQVLLNVDTTDANGIYTFRDINNTAPNNLAKDYTVRVVSSSLNSTRGNAAGLLPVQTYRTETEPITTPDGIASSVVPIADKVGGEKPGVADDPAGTTIGFTPLPANAQNIAKVRVAGADLLRVDFGFNFDTVVNTNDSGQGSMRQALLNANALPNGGLSQAGLTPGIEHIIFMIPNGSSSPGMQSGNNAFTAVGGASAAKITLNSPLPTITDPVVVNATLQPGFTATPVIWIDGSSVGASGDGFAIAVGGQGSSLIGLSIGGFSGNGIWINGGSNNQIKGNFIGLDPSRAASGNAKGGILITNASSNVIGGTNAGEPNVIAHNGSAGGGGGVVVDSGNSNAIRRNSIFQNKGLGIDLKPLGVTANDGNKGAGPNSGMDYPVITGVTPSGGNLVVNGFIGKSAATASTFGSATVEIFVANDDGDQNGEGIAGDGKSIPHGEGETYLATVTAAANGSFTATIPVIATPGAKITATATDASGNTSEFAANIPAGASAAIKGTVFEDPVYPGGAGRPFGTAGTVGVPNATVELYDNNNALLSTTTTDTNGAYTFADLAEGTYVVRVVSASVPSSRAGYVTGLLPVQTFRTDGQTGSAVAVTDHVGGEDPAKDDTAVGVLATTGSVVSQSVTTVLVGANDVAGIDFGFNFNTVVNIRDTGQGSLRQFVLNANALSGADTAIFMISNGTSGSTGLNPGGLRPALNYFTSGIAPITLATALPAITEQAIISGANQPGYSGTPVVEVNGSGGAATGLTVSGGTGSVIDSLALNRFSSVAITLSGPGSNIVTGNRIGTSAAGTAAYPNGQGVVITASPNNVIGGTLPGKGNTISGNTGSGVQIIGAGASGNLVQGNGIGVDAAGTGALANGGSGVVIENGASQNIVGGTVAGAGNRIAFNGAGGIVVKTAATGNTFQRNAIWANTGLGIDLGADGVTPNTGVVGSGPNAGMNYPVFSVALNGSTLRLVGFIGSASGQATFAGASIELYRANNAPADQNGAIISGDSLSVPHGEGETFLATIVADGSGNFDVSIPVAGVNIGDSLTAIATHPATGSTSEFSANVQVGIPVSGFVYRDANRDHTRNDGEGGTGLTLYAKLLANGAGPAVSVVAVDPATGAYEFPGVLPGTWAIVVNADSGASNVTPGYPAGWTGTEFPDGKRHPVVVNNHALTNLNFGVVPYVQLTGHVFADTGTGIGGVANDGVRNGAEKGVADVVVKLISDDGSMVYHTTTTGSGGSFTLLIDNAIPSGTPLKIVKINPASYLSTGAVAGNTGGSYLRDADTIALSYAENTDYSGIEFGIVPLPGFETDGQQAGLPGTIVFFPHTFTAGSAGTVVFSTSAEATPALNGWVETIHLDTNENGQFDAGEPIITGPLTVSAGQVVKILVKEFIPVNAPNDVRNKVTVTADFTYTGSPAPTLVSSLTRTDVTFVGNHVGTGLVLSKSVDKTTALPGEELVYTLKFTNKSTDPLSNIVIYDVTPEFTTFVSSSWTTPLPDHITGITPTTPEVGETGALKWTINGSLLPGAEGTITFTVKVVP